MDIICQQVDSLKVCLKTAAKSCPTFLVRYVVFQTHRRTNILNMATLILIPAFLKGSIHATFYNLVRMTLTFD